MATDSDSLVPVSASKVDVPAGSWRQEHNHTYQVDATLHSQGQMLDISNVKTTQFQN